MEDKNFITTCGNNHLPPKKNLDVIPSGHFRSRMAINTYKNKGRQRYSNKIYSFCNCHRVMFYSVVNDIDINDIETLGNI